MAAPAPKLAYASFGRRCAALSIDMVLLALIAVVVVEATILIGLRVFEPVWRPPAVAGVVRDVLERFEQTLPNGDKRLFMHLREARVHEDKSIRIYSITEQTITDTAGKSQTDRSEMLLAYDAPTRNRLLATGVGFFGFALLYFWLWEGSRLQASPGKRLLGLRVTDLNGNRLGAARTLFRQLAKCVDVISSFLTYLIAAFTSRGQALHDILAGTLVLRAAAPLASTGTGRLQEFIQDKGPAHG